VPLVQCPVEQQKETISASWKAWNSNWTLHNIATLPEIPATVPNKTRIRHAASLSQGVPSFIKETRAATSSSANQPPAPAMHQCCSYTSDTMNIPGSGRLAAPVCCRASCSHRETVRDDVSTRTCFWSRSNAVSRSYSNLKERRSPPSGHRQAHGGCSEQEIGGEICASGIRTPKP
jgi:hypothetical protein